VKRLVALVLVLGALAAGSALGGRTGAAEERPAVLAASSLTEVLPRLEPEGRFSFAGSNQLAQQIRQGAPFDVYLSASPLYTQALFGEGLVRRPVAFATNSLVLIVPRSNPQKLRSVGDLARRPKLRLVVAGPKVPIGLYTREVLKRLGMLGVLRKTVSQEPDVKGVVGKLALGEADAGFVYATDVKAASSRITAIPIPRRGQPTVRYEVAVVSRTSHDRAAWSFLADLLSATGRQALARAGFGLP
jgi:molybdate transport system substrate-binding protein